jgi:hypothetical protein
MSLDTPFNRTFPPPRRLLDSFHTNQERELSSAIPSGFFQAHSSIRKDWGCTFTSNRCPEKKTKQTGRPTRA